MYKWTGTEWTALKSDDSNAYSYYMTALQGLNDTGATTQVGAFMSLFCKTIVTQNAFIENLKASVVELQENGYQFKMRCGMTTEL